MYIFATNGLALSSVMKQSDRLQLITKISHMRTGQWWHFSEVRFLSFNSNPETIDDLQNYCVGACNEANQRCQVRCQAGRAHAKDWARRNHAYKFPPPEADGFEQPPNTLLETACFKLNENVLVLKMKQGTVKWQGLKVGHWPMCWLSGSCPRAQCQRWWTMNTCHSVVSCLIFKKYPSREDASNNVLNLKIWSYMKPVDTFFS